MTSETNYCIPVMNKIRGFDTPRLNKMGQDGITFTRMYTEPSCTPTRAAALTGRLAARSGVYTVAFPPEGSGLPAEEVTIAEVLSKAGYNTAFYAKAHQGDIEESYMHNQGFDEAQFSLYNQFPPIFWHETGTVVGITTMSIPVPIMPPPSSSNSSAFGLAAGPVLLKTTFMICIRTTKKFAA